MKSLLLGVSAACLMAAIGCATSGEPEEAPKKAHASNTRAEPGTVEIPAGSEHYGRPGYAVYERDGRLWVFRAGSAALQEYVTKGEPAKRVTLVGAGPDRRTMVGPDRETIDAYLKALEYGREGFAVIPVEGRLWVFRTGSTSLREYLTQGEPAKRVTLVGAGPDRCTVVGPDRETIDAYLVPWKYGRDGFEVFLVDGRLWVFRAGTSALEEFQTKGEPAKRVTLVGAGPDRHTVVGPDRETLDAYLLRIRQ